MNDTEEREGEEVLAKRLIERLENPDPSPTDERGLVAADHIALDKVHSSTEIDESHLGPEHPANTAVFAKVEKSLMSLGFFTPSSRRIKNEKQKTINFVRTVAGKWVEGACQKFCVWGIT